MTGATLVCLHPNPMAQARLICLPYAGGGVSAFGPWRSHIPPSIEVYVLQLPGRENHLSQPPLTEWDAAIEAVIDAARSLPGARLGFYGHSMGGLMAFDAAARMTDQLTHVFVGACAPPHDNIAQRKTLRALLDAPSDDARLNAMIHAVGVATPALDDPAVREIAARVLKSDLLLCANRPTMRPHHGPERRTASPFPPMTVYRGAYDPLTNADDLAGWRRSIPDHASGDIAMVNIHGDHFFMATAPDIILADIAQKLISDNG